MAPKTTSKTPMTDAHKQALAEGRAQARAVRNYLDALEAHKPKRGRKRTPESVRARLEKLDQELADAESVRRLKLIQERLDLLNELEAMENKPDLAVVEDAFVAAAKGYSESKGISYRAWREQGVPAALLKRAGVTRAAG